MRRLRTLRAWSSFALLSLVAGCGSVSATAQQGDGQYGKRPIARNVQAVSYSDLDGRAGAFKMGIQEVRGRWYLYLGHLWHRGWSIVDVTDPKKPDVVNFVDGPSDNTGTAQIDVADGKMITGLQRCSFGTCPSGPDDEGVLIWDVASDPVNPKLLGHFETGRGGPEGGTHRNFYDGGRYVHLAAGMPGFSGNIYVIIDISDPTDPVEAGRWWVPGQHEAGGEEPEAGVSLHEPYVRGDRAYLSYGAAGMIVLDISDPSQPRFIGKLDFSPPFKGGGTAVHSVLPLPRRDLAVETGEAGASRCQEPLNQTSMVDISDASAPVLRSVFPVPVPPPDAPFDDFCDRGGRFGPHNFNQPKTTNAAINRSDQLVHLTYFVAGLRIFDISNPRLPEEVGYFIPPDPTQRFGPAPPDALVLQSEVVLVDSRGYIYLTNKNQGLWILRGTGPAAL